MIGTTLSHYRITEKLGEGGMGIVCRGKDTNLHRGVAIKVLPDEFSHDPERLACFQHEAQVLASLSHPNIAILHGLEESDGKRFIVMELFEGQTLAPRLLKGPWQWKHLRRVIRYRAGIFWRERLGSLLSQRCPGGAPGAMSGRTSSSPWVMTMAGTRRATMGIRI